MSNPSRPLPSPPPLKEEGIFKSQNSEKDQNNKNHPPPLLNSNSLTQNFNSASFLQRSAAWCLDLIPFQLMGWLFSFMGSDSGGASVLNTSASEVDLIGQLSQMMGHFLFWSLVVFVFYAGYHLFFETLTGTTPGKYLIGLRVLSTEPQNKNSKLIRPTFPQGVVRFISAGLSWLTLNYGHVMIQMRPDRASLHDLMSHTKVVNDPKVPFDLLDWIYLDPLSTKTHQIFLWGAFLFWIAVSVLDLVKLFNGLTQVMAGLVV